MSVAEACRLIDENAFDSIITDLRMDEAGERGKRKGWNLLGEGIV